MRPSGFAWLGMALAGLVSGCHAGDAVPVGQAREEIQLGVPDRSDSAVGLLWADGGCRRSSATLITPDVALTASHAVRHGTNYRLYIAPEQPVDLETDDAVPGQSFAPPEGLVGYDVDATASLEIGIGEGCPADTFDVGLLHLVRPVEGVQPMSRLSEGPPAVDTVCRTVGFGIHTEDGKIVRSTKRAASVRVVGSDETNIETVMVDGIPDKGDSGGPLICAGVISGVTRCHHDGRWPAHRREFFTRVDPVGAWIAETIEGWSHRPPSPQ